MIDEELQPWLLEVNSAPSIMAVHSDPAMKAKIKLQKQSMLRDLVAMVQHRFMEEEPPGGCGGEVAGKERRRVPWQQQLVIEMTERGGFEPLMGMFPVGREQIPWQPEDRQLQQSLQRL
jgi:hypothetical protein